MEIFYEEESMKKMKFIGLFCTYYLYKGQAVPVRGAILAELAFLVMQKSQSQLRLKRQSQIIADTLSIKEISIF